MRVSLHIALVMALVSLTACGLSKGTGSGGSAGTTSSRAGGSGGTTGVGGATGTGGTTGATGTGGTTGATGTGGAAPGCDGIDATFAAVLAKPLSGCGGFDPPCHHTGAGELHLDPNDAVLTWSALVNVDASIPGAGKRVAPGDPVHSFLYRKLTNDLVPDEGGPMPAPGGLANAMWQELPQSDLDIVRCWILAGAKND